MLSGRVTRFYETCVLMATARILECCSSIRPSGIDTFPSVSSVCPPFHPRSTYQGRSDWVLYCVPATPVPYASKAQACLRWRGHDLRISDFLGHRTVDSFPPFAFLLQCASAVLLTSFLYSPLSAGLLPPVMSFFFFPFAAPKSFKITCRSYGAVVTLKRPLSRWIHSYSHSSR